MAHGVWGLMNMAFQAEQRIKSQIMTTLGMDQVFRLLSDTEIHVVMKTLGLLRNLLSNKHHIDHITSLYGKQLMQAVVLILESEPHSPLQSILNAACVYRSDPLKTTDSELQIALHGMGSAACLYSAAPRRSTTVAHAKRCRLAN